MGQDYPVSTVMFQYALKFIKEAGMPVTELLAKADLDLNILLDADEWESHQKLRHLMAEAAKFAGNEYFWLKRVNPEGAARDNVGWYYYMNANTVREAGLRTITISRLTSKGAWAERVEEGDEFMTRYSLRSPKYTTNRYLVDWALSGWCSTVQYFAGPALHLKSVHLQDNDPERKIAYEAFYQVPCLIGQSHNQLVFPRSGLELPNALKNPDPNLDVLLTRLIQAALGDATESTATPLKEEIFRVLQNQLIHGKPTIHSMANSLGVSSRTLQRRISDEGTSYSELVQNARRELAASYLKEEGLNITDVALLLGYRESSSFTVAFRQWYDSTPIEYRRQLREE